MKLLLLLLVTVFSAAPVSAQAPLDELDKSYADALQSGGFDAHLALIEQLLNKNDQDFETLLRSARGIWAAADLIYWQSVQENIALAKPGDVDDVLDAEAELTSEQGKILIELGRKMWRLGEAAETREPKRVEGYFYHGLGISFYAFGKSILAALREGLRGKFDDALDKSMEIDADFAGAAPLRVKGRSYFKLPWPLRDYEKAILLAKRSTQSAPEVSVNYLFLGDAYWRNGQEELALQAWDKVIELGPGEQAVQGVLLAIARRKVDLGRK